MARLGFDERLTQPDKKLAKQLQATHAGQAHFGGTGPRGKTCRECLHWLFNGYLSGKSVLKMANCGKFTKLMNGRIGGVIPHDAAACKYFTAVDNAPPI